MSEKDKISEIKVTYDGVFDFKEVYSFLYTLLSDWNYNIDEKVYTEKSKGDSKELEIKWEAERKVSDYFKFQLNVEWRILGMKDVEITKDGKKSKANSGKVEIKISGYLIRDYEEKWSSTPFFRFIRGIYDKYLIGQTKEDYEEKIGDEIKEASDQLKAFLVLEGKK